MKPGDLVRVFLDAEERDLGIILEITRNVTDCFQKNLPFAFAKILSAQHGSSIQYVLPPFTLRLVKSHK